MRAHLPSRRFRGLLVPIALFGLAGCETVIGADFGRSLRRGDAGDTIERSDPTAPDQRSDVEHEAGTRDASRAGADDEPHTGPGPAGALSAGFCCTSHSECRSRVCATSGDGTRQCVELCGSRCEGGSCKPVCPSQTPDGVCSEENVCSLPPGVACRDPKTFERGAKEFGESCRSDVECDGNLCLSFDDGPAQCSQGCATSSECPSQACIGEGVCDVR